MGIWQGPKPASAGAEEVVVWTLGGGDVSDGVCRVQHHRERVARSHLHHLGLERAGVRPTAEGSRRPGRRRLCQRTHRMSSVWHRRLKISTVSGGKFILRLNGNSSVNHFSFCGGSMSQEIGGA